MEYLETSFRVTGLNEDSPIFEGLNLSQDIPWELITKTTFEHVQAKPKEISLSFCEAEEIQSLNKDYRNKDSVTDVLSFVATNDPNLDLPILGDIVICLARASEQAQEIGHSLKREVSFLYVHGLLHLLGYDHEEKADEEVMFGLQRKILEACNIID